MTVQETILEQLGGRRFAMMTGSKDFISIFDDTLQMTLAKNSSGANRLMIRLDFGKDLYSMRFLKVTGGKLNKKTWEFKPQKIEVVAEYEDIYCDQLAEIFREVTGLETRMPKIIGING